MTGLSFNCQSMFQENIPVYHLQLAQILGTQLLGSICVHSSPSSQHLLCVVGHSSCGCLWFCLYQMYAKIAVCRFAPRNIAHIRLFWKFCCKFVTLVSASLTDGKQAVAQLKLHMGLAKTCHVSCSLLKLLTCQASVIAFSSN